MSFFSFLKGQNNPFIFERIGKENGLAHNTVFSVVQDKMGFIWIATAEALCRYDGYNFKIFRHDPANIKSLGSGLIHSIIADQNGKLWLGTDKGLCYFDPSTESFENYSYATEQNLNNLSNFVRNVFIDSKGIIWVCALKGLSIFDPLEKKFYSIDAYHKYAPILNEKEINCLKEDRKSNLWIGTSDGLFYFARKSKDIKIIGLNLPEKLAGIIKEVNIFDIYINSDTSIYLAMNFGITKYNPLSNKFAYFQFREFNTNNFEASRVRTIFKDSYSNLWVGTQRSGLFLFNPNKGFTNYSIDFNKSTSTSSDQIQSIFEDKNANLWISTLNDGVNKVSLNRKQFQNMQPVFCTQNGLAEQEISSIFVDSKKKIWIGFWNGGVDCYEPQTGNFEHLKYIEGESSFIPGTLGGICEDSEQNMWFASWAGMICNWNPKNKKISIFKGGNNQLQGWSFRSLIAGNNGEVYVGSMDKGIEKYNPKTKKFEEIEINKKGREPNIIKLVYRNDSEFFVCMVDGYGIFNTKKNSFQYFSNDQFNAYNLPSHNITCIYEDKKKRIWLTTEGAGLCYKDQDEMTFHVLPLEKIVPSQSIFCVYPDHQGNLWMSTSNGICKYKRSSTLKNSFRSYDEFDGIASTEFRLNAHCSDGEGILYFGSNKGLTYFNPDSILDNYHSPIVAITDLKILNRSVSIGEVFNGKIILEKSISETEKIKLSWRENDFSIEFAALNFSEASKSIYKYRMFGYDSKWKTTGVDRRFATYTSLSAGKYTFEVYATNNDGTWSAAPARLVIVITPPFWRAIWFKAFALMSLIGMIIIFYQWRIKRVARQRFFLKERIFERTRELNAVNALLMEQREEMKIHADSLYDANKELTQSIEYAKRLQQAILTSDNTLSKIFPDHFILNLPKAIVSGDFYWFKKYLDKNYFFLAIGDCTGHGISGAFVSMLGIGFLNEIIAACTQIKPKPNQILEELRNKIKKSLNQKGHFGETNDGMDIGLCAFDLDSRKLYFSGAHIPLYLLRNKELYKVEADKMPIGIYHVEAPFTCKELYLEKGDQLYLSSDGFSSQFGGEKGNKFATKRFKELITMVSAFPIDDQKEIIINSLAAWMNQNQEQVDDILVMGLKVP